MKSLPAMLFSLLILSFCPDAGYGDPARLYGQVFTVDGEVFEGFIRWDRNEISWDDILDGNKQLDDRGRKRHHSRDDRNRTREVKIFGITVYRESGSDIWNWSGKAESGIKFGHIQKLVPIGDDEVLLILKSGEEVELTGGSGDIGEDNREIIVEDGREGILELYWDDIDEIVFSETPNLESKLGERLYGTLVTRRGDEFTGFIAWDIDEVLDTDILDGKEDRRKRQIEFGQIRAIERRSSQSAIVTLKNGRELRMRGTNDVDNGNRGIVISDIDLGRIVVDWDEFDALSFTDPPASGTAYSRYDGGRRLRGTVYTENGEEFTGDIRWDDDEEYTWELLNGEYRDIEMDIELAHVKAIEKTSYHGSMVTLNDGRTFKLRDCNDIDGDNKGIFISGNDEEIVVEWEDFDRIEFTH